MNRLLWQLLHPVQAACGRRYRRQVNAPLRPETVEALAAALKRGDVKIRRIQPRRPS